jgi:predicted HTH domain antitoxin
LCPIFAGQSLSDWYTTPMEITLSLPEDIANGLGSKWKDVLRVALESLALEGYRSGALSALQLRRLLGFETRYELDGFLKQHGVYLNYTVEDLEQEAEASRKFSSRR